MQMQEYRFCSKKIDLVGEERVSRILEDFKKIGIEVEQYWLKYIRLLIELITIYDINAKYNDYYSFPYETVSTSNYCIESILDILKDLTDILGDFCKNKQVNYLSKLEDHLYNLQHQTLSQYNYMFGTKFSNLVSLAKVVSYGKVLNSQKVKSDIIKYTQDQSKNLTQSCDNVINGLTNVEHRGLPYVNKSMIQLISVYNIVADFNQTERVDVGVVINTGDHSLVSVSELILYAHSGKKKLVRFLDHPIQDNFVSLGRHLCSHLYFLMIYNTIYYKFPRITESDIAYGDPEICPKRG